MTNHGFRDGAWSAALACTLVNLKTSSTLVR